MANNATNHADNTPSNASNVEELFSKHREEFKIKSSDIVHDVQDLGGISKKISEDLMVYVQQKIQEYMEQGNHKAQYLERELREHIQKKPFQSLVIAAGVGAILGTIYSRR